MESKIRKRVRKSDGISQPKRTTFLVGASTLQMIKAYAYWKRMPIQEVVDQALNEFLAKSDVLMTLHEYMENNKKELNGQ